MAGNSAARRMMVQVAGQYQHIVRIRLIAACRQYGCPKAVADIT